MRHYQNEDIPFEELEAAADRAREQGWWFTEDYQLLQRFADDLFKLARQAVAVQTHYEGDRVKLIVDNDWGEGCPLCGDRR